MFWVCIRLGGREYLGVLDTGATTSKVAKKILPCGSLTRAPQVRKGRRVRKASKARKGHEGPKNPCRPTYPSTRFRHQAS